jgi:hypothetical protein
MNFTQGGSSVTGTYSHDEGELTDTLEGQLLKGWWREAGNETNCGPGNAWAGPLIFRFSDEWTSFDGDWAYCGVDIEDLDPDQRRWNGTREGTTTTTALSTTTTVSETSTTTSVESDTSTSTTISDTTTTYCHPDAVCDNYCCDLLLEQCVTNWQGMRECRPYPNNCFIFNLYGEDSEEIELLRAFRDEVLNQTSAGQEIIKLYYEWNPLIVEVMNEDEEFKIKLQEMIDGMLPLIREIVE